LFTLPAGLCWTSDGKIERHPDRRVQPAIRMVFDKLSEFGSVRQVLMWLREENVSLPTLESERPREITWRLPTYRIVLSIVRSPFCAGHAQHRALALELEQAHYQAALAARRYEAVDPDSRYLTEGCTMSLHRGKPGRRGR